MAVEKRTAGGGLGQPEPRTYRIGSAGEARVSDRSGFISFQNVSKVYEGEVVAVDRLDLDIRRGEFLTLLGPSGSGKTTTLMMLAGFERPTSGEILFNERSIVSVPAYKRNFGMVFQSYALFPHLTAFENVAFPLQMRRLAGPEVRARALQALRMVQLDGLEYRRIGQLSGGQQQRVALARAVVFNPDLVLLDEPLGALDRKLRERMQAEIKELHRSLDISMVYVTHDQTEALTMSDRIAVFNQGRLQQVDTPDQVYERPSSSFVASFVGESNALHGRIEEFEEHKCVVRLDSGERIFALRGNVSQVGERTTVSVRPERVVVDPDDPGAFKNTLSAEVLEVTYVGDHDRCRIRLAGGTVFVAKFARASGVSTPVVGQAVTICWTGNHCVALDSTRNEAESGG